MIVIDVATIGWAVIHAHSLPDNERLLPSRRCQPLNSVGLLFADATRLSQQQPPQQNQHHRA